MIAHVLFASFLCQSKPPSLVKLYAPPSLYHITVKERCLVVSAFFKDTASKLVCSLFFTIGKFLGKRCIYARASLVLVVHQT